MSSPASHLQRRTDGQAPTLEVYDDIMLAGATELCVVADVDTVGTEPLIPIALGAR